MICCPWYTNSVCVSFPSIAGNGTNVNLRSDLIPHSIGHSSHLSGRARPLCLPGCQPRRRGDLDGRPRPPPSRPTDSPDCSEEVFTRESQTSPFIPPLRRPKGQMLSRTLILSVEMWRREVTLATGCCPDTCTAGSIHPGQHENFCKGER